MNKILNICVMLCCVALIAVGCHRKNRAQAESFCTATAAGDTVSLEYNTAVPIFTGCQENLQARITAISDSRCPKDVVCVWAGKVSVVLQIAPDFNVTLEKDKIVDTTWQHKQYSFHLIDVTPFPVSQPPTQARDQKVTVSIVRREK